MVGCADGESGAPAFRPPAVLDESPLNPAARHDYLSRFPLLDSQGEASSPEDPASQVGAFGVLLKLPQKGSITVCSATHVAAGVVLTNAHCLPGYPNARIENFFIVYYSKTGRKKYTALSDYIYVGNPLADDVALLQIPPAVAVDWDSVEGNVRLMGATIGARPASAVPVTVWAFDPFDAHSVEGLQHGRPGMRFRPRECLLSRTLPEVLGLEMSGTEEVRVNILGTTNAKESLHVFLDNCSSHFVLGNSGSLITLSQSIREKIGVYHWVVGPTEVALERFSSFEYTGNNGKAVRLARNRLGMDFFGVGFALENLKQFPLLFGRAVEDPILAN